jgi:RHH-type proline utilization regulon transcriptional repressor/proline dehydrogenase/delta 1-pyrroline-5-carboxylate dehydrogenase
MSSIAQRAVEVAGRLAVASAEVQTAGERREALRLARMMEDPRGKAFTFALVDQVFRSQDRRTQGSRLRQIVRQIGFPSYLSLSQGLLLRAAVVASRWIPGPVMAAVEAQLRRDSGRVILAGELEKLKEYLIERKAAGTRVNLNYLGEAVLGEKEAEKRLRAVLDHLRDPLVDCISVKISAIFSQTNLVDWDGTLAPIKDRLRRMYRAAMPARKFVYLDMEAYSDLSMTLAAFTQVLDEAEFGDCHAGVAIQGYLPDSWTAQQWVTEWAKKRVAEGGAPIRLRLVKGANLAMENVEAELHGWNPAPYATKADTDANYRRMLEFGCQPENARAVRLGVASHNLFDVGLALVLREEMGVANFVELEMLEGMANHQARAVQARAGGLLVYAPAVKRADFFSAMAYLVRRLDENTAPENFLREMFQMTPGSQAWEGQRRRFVAGWENRVDVSSESRRATHREISDATAFQNAADTDWTQQENRQRLQQCISHWRSEELPPLADLKSMLSEVQSAQEEWEARGWAERANVLRRCADLMEQERFGTIVQMMHEGKKAAWEGDVEVSEAIDFARYYAATPTPPMTVKARALGIVVVTPPWNFPYAIPCSGVFAALMAGNGVVLKPAPETVEIAWRIARQLWAAGVPKEILQFFPCPDGAIGQALIEDERVAAVVLTGAYETARMFLKWRPSLRLLAETSGKNAIIITDQADRDLAIKDLVKSAFGHSGQKCSAASLAILHHRVYDDPHFRRALCDAASSLRVGPATDLANVVTPLIREPHPALLRAFTTLDDGEEWLLRPKVDPSDPCLWSPGIKLGVKPNGWFHQTECFGPVLGLMRAADLDEAIAFQNGTPFGLTGGIHSLDEEEISHWRERVLVGNAYINRAITGAIVQRQPFGGWKKSSLGSGAKAGGPNYVSQFLRFEDAEVFDVEKSYRDAFAKLFSTELDPSRLQSESNIQRYRPCKGVILRAEDEETCRRAKLAAEICGVNLHISLVTKESESELAARLPELAHAAEFLRTLQPPGDKLLAAAYACGLNWVDGPIVAEGRIELTRWFREQSVLQTRHRYGLISRK